MTMKNLILFIGFAVALQACTKIESEAVECSPPIAKPEISNSAYTKSIGDYLSVIVTNADSELDYRWKTPDGELINGTILSLLMDRSGLNGTYSVVAIREDGSCTSAEKFFTVDLDDSAPDCGMSENTFKVTGSGTQNVTLGEPAYSYSKAYMWDISGAQRLEIYYSDKPGTTARVDAVSNQGDYSDLPEGQAAMRYRDNSYNDYDAIEGSVHVQKINNVYYFKFCNVKVKRVGYSSTGYINGTLRATD